MNDIEQSPFYVHGLVPPAVKRRPGEHVWTMRKGTREIRCKFRGYGELGWETQVFENGLFFYGQRFVLREEAQRLADEKRLELERRGWGGSVSPKCDTTGWD